MKKVVIAHNMPGPGKRMLEEAGFSVIVLPEKKHSERSLASLVSKHQPDALISFLTDPVTKPVMTASANLKLVSNYAAGYNNIDLSAAKDAGVSIANTPYDGYFVAEFAASLTVSLARKIVEANTFTVKGKYKGWDPNLFIGTVLRGKTLGLVGAGRIGTQVAFILSKGFGMNVVYSDAVANESLEREVGAARVELDELFKLADVVSLHAPLTEETRHLVDARRLSLMKPTAFLINTARGPIIDEKALSEALSVGTIAGAALDVFEFEPKISRSLRNLPNVILTPHIASATAEARDEMSRTAAQNVIDFFAGKRPPGAIDIQ